MSTLVCSNQWIWILFDLEKGGGGNNSGVGVKNKWDEKEAEEQNKKNTRAV